MAEVNRAINATIAKCASFEYIADAPISAEKSSHSNPNDTLACLAGAQNDL